MTQPPPPGPPPGRAGSAPQPGEPGPQPMGWLRVTLQGSALTSSIITPAVSVNGWRVPASYGENVIPVHAGPNRVDVSCQWLWRYGEASLATDVPAGGQVSLYYAAPMHQLSRGAIGFTQQKRQGLPGFTLLLGVVVLLVVALVVLAR
jgi:hypothetical protein